LHIFRKYVIIGKSGICFRDVENADLPFVGAFSKTRLLQYSTMLAIAAFAAGCRSYENN
jgi:hypothetical protein